MAENLRVWAPRASRLTLHLPDRGEVLPMTPVSEYTTRVTMDADSGWWISPDPLPAGTRYLLAVDDRDPVPDPRTRRQPEGIHGPSEIVDVEAFAWTDAHWRGVEARGAVTYELHIGTFTPEGTFAAAAAKLPYLRELGIDFVEIMPITPVPGRRNWGYDGVELYAVTENYGGPESFAAFVDAAHSNGIGVCLDVVYNHLGPDGNYLSFFGPYFTDTHKTPWGSAVNLDSDSSGPVRQFLLDNAMQWVRDYHVDALRLDAVAYLIDTSNRHILAELSDTIHAFAAETGRFISLIAESDLNDPLMVTPTNEGGYGMDCQWDDDIHHALHTYATGETFAYYADFAAPGALEKVMRHGFLHDGTYSTFRERIWGAPVPENIDGHAFIGCTEDHDQVGNRALGDRPSAALTPGQRAAQLGLLLASPYSPMLFMGQEWGTRTPFQFFTDHHEELGRLVAEGRQREFSSWDWLSVYPEHEGQREVPHPQHNATFSGSILDWSEKEDAECQAFLAFTRAALALRASTPDFASGDRLGTELVRFGRAGYLRRGASYAVYSFDGEATVSLPVADVQTALTWGAPRVTHPRDGMTQVFFEEPGIVFLV